MTWNPKGNGAAASSLASYKLLRFGDLAFEGNRTKGHPYGKLVINDIGAGIMSSRFRTLSAREVPCTSFWKQFLMVDSVFRRIYIRSTKRGTLMTELVVDNLLDSAVPLPSQSEQETIGAFFRSLDNLITLHQRKQIIQDLCVNPSLARFAVVKRGRKETSLQGRCLGFRAPVLHEGMSFALWSYWHGQAFARHLRLIRRQTAV